MTQGRRITILLVEDNEGDSELTSIAFDRGHVPASIALARDGVEAMDYVLQQGKFAHATPPDLILLDINMPRMNGMEFLKRIKQDEKLRVIPVIMLTSSSARRDILTSYQNYANSYILKPEGLKEGIDMAKQIENFWINLTQLPV